MGSREIQRRQHKCEIEDDVADDARGRRRVRHAAAPNGSQHLDENRPDDAQPEPQQQRCRRGPQRPVGLVLAPVRHRRHRRPERPQRGLGRWNARRRHRRKVREQPAAGAGGRVRRAGSPAPQRSLGRAAAIARE